MLDIRTGLAGMDEFFTRYPGEEYPGLAGLFLFLSENRPETSVTTWRDYRDFPASARALSVCLAGALHGRTRLGLEVRPQPRLAYLLDMAGVLWINSRIDSVRLVEPKQEVKIHVQETEEGKEETLLIADEILLHRVTRQMAGSVVPSEKTSAGFQDDAFSRPQPPDSANQKTNLSPVPLTDATEEGGTVSVFGNVLEKLQNSDLIAADAPVTRLAVEICRRSGWNDLISTCILLKDRDYVLESRTSKHELRLPGFITPEYRVNRPDEFKKRLAGFPRARLEELLGASQLDKLVHRVVAQE
jgi:hypothetical protein